MTPEHSPDSPDKSRFGGASEYRDLQPAADAQPDAELEKIVAFKAEQTERALREIEKELGESTDREGILKYNERVQDVLGFTPGARVASPRSPRVEGGEPWVDMKGWTVDTETVPEKGLIRLVKPGDETTGGEPGAPVYRTTSVDKLRAAQPAFSEGETIDPGKIPPPVEGMGPYRILYQKENLITLASAYGDSSRGGLHTEPITPVELYERLHGSSE